MTEHDEPTAVRLQRRIPAPPERVYRAWLEPEIMRRWLAPAIFSVGKAEVDERVGGRISVWHQDADGNHVGGSEATIEELVPPERIVLSWQFVGPDRSTDPALESRLTISFVPAPDGGTLLSLTHERLGGLRAHAPEIADNVRAGWDSALDAMYRAFENKDRKERSKGTMTMQPNDITEVLNRPYSQELLARDLTRLAYVAEDGTPRAIPIGFTWNGSQIVMCTTKNSPKLPSLRHNPAVALTIDTEVHPPKILLIRGRAELDVVDGIPEEYLEMNGTYRMTPEQRVEWEAEVRSLYDGMVRIVVTPTWVKLIDFETTLPSAVEELARQRDERRHAGTS